MLQFNVPSCDIVEKVKRESNTTQCWIPITVEHGIVYVIYAKQFFQLLYMHIEEIKTNVATSLLWWAEVFIRFHHASTMPPKSFTTVPKLQFLYHLCGFSSMYKLTEEFHVRIPLLYQVEFGIRCYGSVFIQ